MYHFHVADDHPLFRNAILGVIQRHYPDAVVSQSTNLDTTIQELENNDDIDLLVIGFAHAGEHRSFWLDHGA